MEEYLLELYWVEMPIGKENAITYPELCESWNVCERNVRSLLHDLSRYDNGDNYILVRSASGKGFYRTDDPETIKAYRQECLNKGRSIFAPIKKINRVLNSYDEQFSFENNLRVEREATGMTQAMVCNEMRKYDNAFDKSLLSKMENNVCLPTYFQLSKLAEIYGCTPSELVNGNFYI